MTGAVLRQRLPAMLALALPVLAGAAWMGLAGAPSHYPLVNLGALVIALAWTAFGVAPERAWARHALAAVLIVLMLVPLVAGQVLVSITGEPVVRWIPLGPLSLHAGMLATPTLALLAARDRAVAAPILLAALFAALLQPDAGIGFAITFAAVGLHHVTRDWKVALVIIVAFFASLAMSVAGELAPQPFVEQVLRDSFAFHPVMTLALALATAASFALVLFALPLPRAERFTLAGLLFGLIVAAMMAPYPMPLIGYGAAPILGFGLAFGLNRKTPQ